MSAKIMSAKILHLPLSQVFESPKNPRRLFNPEKLEELAASIRKHGILQPLVVRQVRGRYELIAGARRKRAAEIAKLKTVPAIVRAATDKQTAELMLIENLQRAELELLDECEAFHTLIDEEGYTQAAIADAIGKSISYVSRIVGLRNLIPEARSALVAGKLGRSHAQLLAASPAKDQRRAMKVRERSTHGNQMRVDTLRETLHPGSTARTSSPTHQAPPSAQRCWRCVTKLEYTTDGNGREFAICRPCTKQIEELQSEVRRLTRELKGPRAA